MNIRFVVLPLPVTDDTLDYVQYSSSAMSPAQALISSVGSLCLSESGTDREISATSLLEFAPL